jgi:hypothetical protein
MYITVYGPGDYRACRTEAARYPNGGRFSVRNASMKLLITQA